ncbi:hypothetical protein QSJ18_00775 [Gordonia sp. ABSL1-1]|uniref:esterase/lipase family protein n=1 Tax=Gordonia sp. ABSL1-1 TaxID=3053923 RepID=UPI002573C75B|nr:hypothetical protein [Gordonia sp. ABSL1-1]MDL9935269.1 hypothetical protein [Gordonia sp. ABSL1-1]
MKTRLFRLCVAIAALATATVAGVGLESPASAAPRQLPVTYGNAAMVDKAATDWDGPTAGADDDRCRPSSAHPRPVVLVGSTFLSAGVNWTSIAPYLHNAGYCVFTVDYGKTLYRIGPGLNGLDPLSSSAIELDRAVAHIQRVTGTRELDFVGHSQGGLVIRYFLNQIAPHRGSEHEVSAHTVVLLSSPYSMTGPIDFGPLIRDHAPAAVRDAARRAGRTAPFPLSIVNPWEFAKAQTLQPGVRYVQITDVADEMGMLGGMMPPRGARNATTTYLNAVCPTDFSQHFAQPYSPTAVALIGNALDPAHARTPPCAVVPLYSVH